jgi:mRNA interferase HicA
MKPAELMRILARKGARFAPGNGSHMKAYLNGRMSPIPVHNKDLKTGTFHAILKQLGLSKADLEE